MSGTGGLTPPKTRSETAKLKLKQETTKRQLAGDPKLKVKRIKLEPTHGVTPIVPAAIKLKKGASALPVGVDGAKPAATVTLATAAAAVVAGATTGAAATARNVKVEQGQPSGPSVAAAAAAVSFPKRVARACSVKVGQGCTKNQPSGPSVAVPMRTAGASNVKVEQGSTTDQPGGPSVAVQIVAVPNETGTANTLKVGKGSTRGQPCGPSVAAAPVTIPRRMARASNVKVEQGCTTDQSVGPSVAAAPVAVPTGTASSSNIKVAQSSKTGQTSGPSVAGSIVVAPREKGTTNTIKVEEGSTKGQPHGPIVAAAPVAVSNETARASNVKVEQCFKTDQPGRPSIQSGAADAKKHVVQASPQSAPVSVLVAKAVRSAVAPVPPTIPTGGAQVAGLPRVAAPQTAGSDPRAIQRVPQPSSATPPNLAAPTPAAEAPPTVAAPPPTSTSLTTVGALGAARATLPPIAAAAISTTKAAETSTISIPKEEARPKDAPPELPSAKQEGPSSSVHPIKAVKMNDLKTKYTGELEYMLREFRKLERQLLGAKGATQIEESAGSRERREKLHSFILHLEDTIRQIDLGCQLEEEGKSTVNIGVGGPEVTSNVNAQEEAKRIRAESVALCSLTHEKEEEENVQKLEEHILANLLPVKVRLKKQLAAQQGATRNPAGMPVTRRGMLQPTEADRGKGTFAAAAEQRRKEAEAFAAAQHQQIPAEPVHPDKTYFGKPLGKRGSSLTQKLHGQTLGSKSRTQGHGVGITKPPEGGDGTDGSGRKMVYGGVALGSKQVVSGVVASSYVHNIVVNTPPLKTKVENLNKPAVAPAPAAPQEVPRITPAPSKTTSQEPAAAMSDAPPPVSAVSNAQPISQESEGEQLPTSSVGTIAAFSRRPNLPTTVLELMTPSATAIVIRKKLENPDISEEERLKLRRKLKKKLLLRRARRREFERQRQFALQSAHTQAPTKTATGKKKAVGGKANGKKQGPRSVEYICALCSEAYSSVCDYNPWWALAQHECPKCRKGQIPRIDISAPANAIEYHPALLAHVDDGGAAATAAAAASSATPELAAPCTSYEGGEIDYGSDSEFGSDLSDITDGNLSEISLDSDDSDADGLASMTAAEKAEQEKFGLEYKGPGLSDSEASRLIIVMLHANGCPGRHKQAKHRDVCRSTKFMMLHVRDCPGTTSTLDVCPFPWCRKVKHLLYHLVSCTDPPRCAICSPANLTKGMSDLSGLNQYRLKRQRERMIASYEACAAARQQQLNVDQAAATKSPPTPPPKRPPPQRASSTGVSPPNPKASPSRPKQKHAKPKATKPAGTAGRNQSLVSVADEKVTSAATVEAQVQAPVAVQSGPVPAASTVKLIPVIAPVAAAAFPGSAAAPGSAPVASWAVSSLSTATKPSQKASALMVAPLASTVAAPAAPTATTSSPVTARPSAAAAPAAANGAVSVAASDSAKAAPDPAVAPAPDQVGSAVQVALTPVAAAVAATAAIDPTPFLAAPTKCPVNQATAIEAVVAASGNVSVTASISPSGLASAVPTAATAPVHTDKNSPGAPTPATAPDEVSSVGPSLVKATLSDIETRRHAPVVVTPAAAPIAALTLEPPPDVFPTPVPSGPVAATPPVEAAIPACPPPEPMTGTVVPTSVGVAAPIRAAAVVPEAPDSVTSSAPQGARVVATASLPAPAKVPGAPALVPLPEAVSATVQTSHSIQGALAPVAASTAPIPVMRASQALSEAISGAQNSSIQNVTAEAIVTAGTAETLGPGSSASSLGPEVTRSCSQEDIAKAAKEPIRSC